MDTPDYAQRLQQQIEQYRHVENMHDLPAIFHYWSNKYLLPKLNAVLEVDSISQFFAEHLRRAASKHKGPYRFASLGAGDCLVEIEIAKSLRAGGMMDFVFECFELSPVLLERANAVAKAANLTQHLRLVPIDLNKWTPREKSYTGIMANHSLHHFVELETIFASTHTALRADGVFVAADMIGRNGHRRWPEVLRMVEPIWATLPSRLKFNRQLNTLDETFVNRDCSLDGFEGIRAQDILPLLATRFEFSHFLAFGGLIDPFIDRGYGHNFDPEDEKDRALIDSIAGENELALAEGRIKPTMMLAVMTPAQVTRPKFDGNLSPEFSVRPPSMIELPLGARLSQPQPVQTPDAAANSAAPVSQATRCGRDGRAPQADAPKVSIIIPVLNKVAFTRKCLDALRRNTPAGLYEVIVWDNGSTDETPAFLQKQSAMDPTVRYFRSEENLGFVGGNNAAAQHARGEFLVLLNNDTEPQPGWLDALLQTVEADASVGAVGAKLIYPDGKLQEAGGIIFRDASGWNYGRTQAPRDPRFNFPREVDYCSAACLLVRTALFRQLGGFDVRYSPAYYEDTDLCFALRHLGYRVVYQPRCEIIHHEGVTSGQDLTRSFKQYQVPNRHKFAEKWKDALTRQTAPDANLVRRASQRIQGQRILVIDPLMPMYDRASGSKRLFEMLKLLAAGGNAVTFIARNGQGGERYAAELQALGIEVYAGDTERMKECGFTVKCWPLDLKQLLHDSQYDTILLSFWYVAEQYSTRIRAWSPQSRVVIDTVDVHFLRERRQAELYQDAKLMQQAADTCRRELNIYRQADALITVTEDDRQALLKEIPQSQIFIVPNIHEVAADVPPVDHRNGCLFVGGFGHPPNEDAVLYFHREIWPRLLQRVPDARWTIIGNQPPAAIQALAGPAIEVTGYVPSMEPYLRSHLVSVAPLRYGAGMKGKIGEALANGLPVVTTSIGAEGMGLENGDGGTLVGNDPETFANHVARLYADRDLWNQLSAQGRQHIESHFTPQCIARQLETILDWSNSFCSIIVLALNQWEHTEKCLASIARHTPEPHEVILVDNGSTDKTSEALRVLAAKNQRVRVIFNRDNRGFATGNNQALAIACGDVVVLLNNDTVVTPGWLGRMLAVLKRHPDTGVVGPMSNSVSGPQQVDATYATDASSEEIAAFAKSWTTSHEDQAAEVGRAVGFCLLARRAVIECIGGLDERFGSGNFEDDDFCIRARLAGWRIRIAKDSFVHHTGSQTFKGAKMDYRAAMLRNWDLFRAKWQLPADVVLEEGYPVPQRLPAGVPLHVPIATLGLTHAITSDRVWTQRPPATARTLTKDELPPAARVGNLDDARSLFGRRDYAAAWAVTLAALAARPFHPEACLLLAEIALTAGDGANARLCAQHATTLAPRWHAAKQFLKRPLKGNATPEWLKLPFSISRITHHASRLTIGVLTKNEEKFIAQCLNSVKGLADQIIVVDTGSTDGTIEIAKALGAEVYSTTWDDDFSAPRNALLEHATGDWILMLDADEELPADQHAKLRADLAKATAIAYRVPLANRGEEAQGRSFVPRLFRNVPGAHYYGRIHEQVFPSLLPLCKSFGLDIALGTAQLLHHGYTKELVRDRNKIERNLNLLRLALAERPDEPNLTMNLGLELVRSGDLDGGIVHYRDAFRLMSAQAPAEVVPELREVLLTQFTSHLYKVRAHDTVVQVLTSPLAKHGGLTASLHFALGLAHYELGQSREAAEQMQLCLRKRTEPCLSPINTDILTAAPNHCLALSLAKLNDVAGAEKAFQAGRKETGRTDDLSLDYAKLLAAKDRTVDALHLLNEIVTTNPQHVAAWRLGGEIAVSRPEYVEFALDWTGEALKALPENPSLQALRAEVLLLTQHTAEALKLWSGITATERTPRALAAAILCATVLSQPALQPAGRAGETAVSRAFVDWYRKLVNFGAQETISVLSSRVGALQPILPSAASVLEAVLAEAEKPEELLVA